MYSDRLILNILTELFDKGERKFVIFPYGKNGVKVAELIERYFTDVYYIPVDNKFCKYSSKIYSFNELERNYTNEIILLTVEEDELNQEMAAKLTFVNEKRIINMNNLFKKELSDGYLNYKVVAVDDRCEVDYFLPSVEKRVKKKSNAEKIKVRILHRQYSAWNSIQTIYEAFESDKRYDIKLVLSNDFENQLQDQMERMKCHYVLGSKYDVKDDEPDIVIISSPYTNTINNCRKYAKQIVVISMALWSYSNSNDEFIRIINRYLEWKPDYFVLDPIPYRKLSEIYGDTIKCFEMTNAKYDGIYRALQSRVYNGFKKLTGKTVFLWAPDHGYEDGYATKYVTFDLYAKFFFEYAAKHRDIGFIMRMHDTFFREMRSQKIWSQEDFIRISEYCDSTENIVWDTSDSYNWALSIADGIFIDAFCGMNISVLSTMKPTCVLYRHDLKAVPRNEELKDVVSTYYEAYGQNDICRFIDMVVLGEDPKKDKRLVQFKKYIKTFDGLNGQRIKQFVEINFLK